ncbi:MAG: IMP dehydrogenase [Candidatus Komeilibacteria bacterium CG11_big_fil_rev_8_21_14_0_20_36_20]|uniref:Inosine-5'-monophosphate dehydrogenase n=1 Tax=Candidatus Komeilibacteria bacterium CG11_big_fil_rev_8_21_14_0_20_36_20 TaxID=1974477 RepID=A0A2H0NAZ7_9BACT|nr:MAG: IMP dehydrogenase [Candidatus Komeilibacteria bacterium CG11_big_fil_rev_8_21_14_0_20_36_20]PIR82045.1 MAG: IMP dehydrogenase [Candidatus Komeilibacteria bacterium CG10_big_fil_rev_8_21_14_0_10_36_65]PJC55024.1 MAG: IMP dehydrogenase [Candidatus Komeilibacteria bacterium CG_4_9_14_0_2_um_filter_36_13]
MTIKTALTYDDVLLVPQKSNILSRQDVDLSTKLSQNIDLKIPLVSANMDTITESKMAIAMALAGGIGIIHRFCSIEIQAKEVAKVKRKQNIVIDQPFTVNPDNTLAEVEKKMQELNCKSFLVTEDDSKELLGILTSRDILFVKNENTLVQDMMTPKSKLITASEDILPSQAKELLENNKIEKLPLVDSAFKIKGLITATDIVRNYNNVNASKDSRGRLLVGAAVGTKTGFMDRATALIEAGADVLVIDIAHGHSHNALEVIKAIKIKYPTVELIGGNIATAQAALDLIQAGVNGIKVGIGPGSTCTTRLTTGFGVPQLTAIMNIYPICQKHKLPLIADGGVKQPGDLVKALAAGANTVMIGGQFAGTEESPGLTITYKGRQYKISRGMASLSAALSRPDAKETADQITPEGIEARVPYRGSIKNIIDQFTGGLRSGMSYGNARNLTELRNNAEFIRITPAGQLESAPHDNEIL